jgi:hypothetical protein
MMASIIEPNRPDIFCSFWEPENHGTVRNLISYLQPTFIELEKQEMIRPYLNDLFSYNVHLNMPSMSYKFHRVASLRRAYEIQNGFNYDVVIQARADNVFFEPLKAQVGLVGGQTGIWCSNGSVNENIDPYISPRMVDNFYIGDRNSIDLASSTFWHLKKQCEQWTSEGKLHQVRIPEIIQSKIWNDLGITIRPLPGSSPFNNFYYDIDRRETPWR